MLPDAFPQLAWSREDDDRIGNQKSGGHPVDVRGITPESVQDKKRDEVSALPIQLGNRRIACGEYFEISCIEGDHDLVWRGSLANVHSIGRFMKTGRILIEGNSGNLTGAEMVGGEIEINGSAGHQLGAEMHGGMIRVAEDVGDHTGAALPGSLRGMRGGEILIGGNAGREPGCRMRRGLIAVAGNSDDFAGYHMLAGTILIGGECGAHVGAEMVRGTIICLSGWNDVQQDAAFRRGSSIQSTIFRLIHRRLKTIGFPGDIDRLLNPMQVYHGSCLNDCRGELLIPCVSTRESRPHRMSNSE